MRKYEATYEQQNFLRWLRKMHTRHKHAENDATLPSILVPVVQDRTTIRSAQFSTSRSTQTGVPHC